MKEHVEILHDQFVDFQGLIHHFTLAAVSKMLPSKASELPKNLQDGFGADDKVYTEVNAYVEDYGTVDYYVPVKKGLHIGLAICNPTDEFDTKVGAAKAIARAKSSNPNLFTTEAGLINTLMVQALLRQEAEYIKNNPETVIKGYAERKKRYEFDQEMINTNFSDLEKAVIDNVQENPKFLDRVYKYLSWMNNKIKGCQN